MMNAKKEYDVICESLLMIKEYQQRELKNKIKIRGSTNMLGDNT